MLRGESSVWRTADTIGHGRRSRAGRVRVRRQVFPHRRCDGHRGEGRGVVKAERLLRQRGRWIPDAAFLYERALVSDHLSLSAEMADVQGCELEAMCAGWYQPCTPR